MYGEIVRKLAPGETVRILVALDDARGEGRDGVLERVGVDPARVEFLRFPTDRGWTRDFGPDLRAPRHRRAEVAIARFRFNAWAKYPDWKKDDQVAERAAPRRSACRLRPRRAQRPAGRARGRAPST